MADETRPALTPEQWEAKDYRQSARDLDRWATGEPAASGDDATEYVAKLGLGESGSVIAMNRAHDRVLIPPPARAPLAAFALAGLPFGFTRADVQAVRRAAERTDDPSAQAELRGIAARLEALLPP
jgi:hypothetical protein